VNKVRHIVDVPFAGSRRKCRQTKQTFAAVSQLVRFAPLKRGDWLASVRQALQACLGQGRCHPLGRCGDEAFER